jgi:hypothetical protein
VCEGGGGGAPTWPVAGFVARARLSDLASCAGCYFLASVMRCSSNAAVPGGSALLASLRLHSCGHQAAQTSALHDPLRCTGLQARGHGVCSCITHGVTAEQDYLQVNVCKCYPKHAQTSTYSVHQAGQVDTLRRNHKRCNTLAMLHIAEAVTFIPESIWRLCQAGRGLQR